MPVFLVRIVLLLFVVYSSTAQGVSRKKFIITDYGAVNDTSVVNTRAIQSAIDASAVNGGVVVVPAGKYVTGTLILRSNVELHLAAGGELLGSISLADYSTSIQGSIEAPAFNKCLIYAENARNLKISGQGIINGRGFRSNFPVNVDGVLGDRPMLIRFINCRNILFNGITLINSASWCTHMIDCSDIVVRNTVINSHVNQNNDGFDLDGCKNVLIEDSDIFSGDDAICLKSTTQRLTENIVVRNCKVRSHTAAFKCGTSSRGGFRNVKITNCDFSGTRMGVIKLQIVDGGILENITISDILMNNVEGPIFIRLGNRGRTYHQPTEQIYEKEASAEGAPVGRIRNVKIRNIKAVIESDAMNRNGIMITGIPGHKVQYIMLENIEISYPGGGSAVDAKREIDEDIARYPEQFFFGVLPSWGAYIRHAENITFKNVKMSTRSADERKKIVLINVNKFIEK